MKRKRSRHSEIKIRKRECIEAPSSKSISSDSAVLKAYYRQVQTLRSYIVSELPGTSRKRRQYVTQYGLGPPGEATGLQQKALAELLDTTLVGSCDERARHDVRPASMDIDRHVFSQHLSESTPGGTSGRASFSQVGIIDFVIWSLFKNNKALRPPHILCHGFTRSAPGGNNGIQMSIAPGIPGLASTSPNPYSEQVKSAPWTGLPDLLGKTGEKILVDLFMRCGIFVPLSPGAKSYSQISGMPLPDLQQQKPFNAINGKADAIQSRRKEGEARDRQVSTDVRGWNSVHFVRHRMFYGKPALNARGEVTFGIRPIHVLNRKRDLDSHEEAVDVMKYIFPRQFGFHNAFTSSVDPKASSQPFLDYTLREQEIKCQALNAKNSSKLPKRLRGIPFQLVQGIRKRHLQCPYKILLHHYCGPRISEEGSHRSTEDAGVFSLATPIAKVSAFCRAVVKHVFPTALWGKDQSHSINTETVMAAIDHFLRLRRYESMTLHDVLAKIKFSKLEWLQPSMTKPGQKICLTDFEKRKELMAELVYYLFDSFLIPLISSNFHVTESSAHRNQLFYFRHDVWRKLAEPALQRMQVSMFEELNLNATKRFMSRRILGTSQVRLLPKDTGLRPIINLRRRILRKVNGKLVLGKSINSAMTPAFNVLNCEKDRHPDRLGASMFSADDLLPRLQAFRGCLEQRGLSGRPLYFAKVDVQSCFDTIPQQELLQMLNGLFSASEYSIGRYAEAKVIEKGRMKLPGMLDKVAWKFHGRAHACGENTSLSQVLEKNESGEKTGVVFVDSVIRNYESRNAIMDILQEHIGKNIVEIGKHYYRQRTGIPQGSIVSTLLCNLFYAQLEAKVLGFVQEGETLLLRLIDDFLLISTRQDVATRFVKVMHAGIPEFGVTVKMAKSRVNFDVQVDGQNIAKLPTSTDFPYCGYAINTVDMNIRKDRERRRISNVAAAVTVEYSKLPGHSFYRKTLSMLKLHMQAMLLSTTFNSVETVLGNLYHGFTDIAERCLYYITSLPGNKQPSPRLVIKTVDDLIQLGISLMRRRRSGKKRNLSYTCAIQQSQTKWLACQAFLNVFQRRQTKHGLLIAWLKRQRDVADGACGWGHGARMLRDVVDAGGL